MFAFRRMLVFMIALAGLCAAALGQQPDQVAAARVLGPQWKEIARVSGMVFSGTVLDITSVPADSHRPIPTVEVKFQVDKAIAGVKSGQVLKIREWAGAWSSNRAMRSGQRMLIFLYPASRLGLTSPAGGPMGQVALDAAGKIVDEPGLGIGNPTLHSRLARRATVQQRVSLAQMERAVRGAREE